MSSILNDVKHILGLLPEQTAFDQDLILLINAQFADLHQIGAGPVEGYEITGPDNQWTEFIKDVRFNSVKSYVFLKVKLMFDPPPSGFATAAMERQIQELTFRINTVSDYG